MAGWSPACRPCSSPEIGCGSVRAGSLPQVCLAGQPYNAVMPASFIRPPPDWLSQALATAQPPQWLLQEAQLKLVLWVNHVLLQAEHALPRTRRLTGRTLELRWLGRSGVWAFTPAGLIETRDSSCRADLVLDWGQASPLTLVGQWLRSERPALRIEGDVQLAAEINWLVDHVRWSPEEDLARVLGDAQARGVFQLGRRLVQGLRTFAAGQSVRESGPVGPRT